MTTENEDFNLEQDGDKGGTGGEPVLPKELEGKSAAEIWKLVEAEKERTAAANKARERAEAISQEIAMAALEGRRAPGQEPKKQDAAGPDKETDPDAWMAWEMDRRVDAKVKPIMDAYTKDRQMVMGGMFESAKTRVAGQFHDWNEHEAQINEFLKNFPADVVAQPGAIEEAYYRVKGRAVAAKEAEARVREQSPMGQGRVGVPERAAEQPKFNADQTRIAQNLGVELGTFTVLDGPGAVSIDEYNAAKVAAAAKAKGGSNATR